MGKTLIIKGADFSANRIRKITTHPIEVIKSTDANVLGNDYLVGIGMTQGVGDDGFNIYRGLSANNMPIPVGAHLIMKDASLWNTYKIAISTSGPIGEGAPGEGSWDSSYSGSPYFREDVVIANEAVYLFIGRHPIDGSYVSITDEDCELLSANLMWYVD